jgi:hypothetical protein
VLLSPLSDLNIMSLRGIATHQLWICITTISVIVTGPDVIMVSLAALRPTITSPLEQTTFGIPLNQSKYSVSLPAVGELTRHTILRVQTIVVHELCLRTAS